MKIDLDINKIKHTVEVEPRTSPARLPARQAPADRRARWLRAWRVRRVYRAGRWRSGAFLSDVRGPGRRLCHHYDRGLVPGPGELSPLQDAFCETTACNAAIARRR